MKSQPLPDRGVAALHQGFRGILLVSLCVLTCSATAAEPTEGEPAAQMRKAQRWLPAWRDAPRAIPVVHKKKAAVAPVRKGILKAKVFRGRRDRAVTPVLGEVPAVALPTQVARPQRQPTVDVTSQPPAKRPASGGASKATFPSSPSPATLVRRCDLLALKGLRYDFGSEDPSSGGLDCSGAVQYLLRQEGIQGVPRTAYTQYQWLKEQGTLNRVSRWSWSKERVAEKIRAGDLLFWTGTYNTGRSPNISHVMIYLGQDANSGKHYMFGASSRRSKGVHGHAVDVYEFVYPRKHGKDNFAGFGSVRGLRR